MAWKRYKLWSAGRPGHGLRAAEEKRRGSWSEVETSWGASGCLSVVGWAQAGMLNGPRNMSVC